MLRRTCALALAVLATAAPAASAHQGNPNYLTQVNAITPAVDGITVDVLNRDDQLLLHNTSGADVVIQGYKGEPYARVQADGTVDVNTDSPAYYLNDDRFAKVKAPADADGKGAPRWKEISRTGRFEWHDHRMHWMSPQPPSNLRDVKEKTKMYDWKVPVRVGDQAGAISGTLFWTPQVQGGPPTGAILGLAAFVIACCIAVTIVRRRRRSLQPAGNTQEAW
jgi:hypothetical protein